MLVGWIDPYRSSWVRRSSWGTTLPGSMIDRLTPRVAVNMAGMDSALEQLAAAHGIATWYRDARRQRVDVDAQVVRRVLGLLGVSTDNPAEVSDALAATRAPTLPGTVVLRSGQRRDISEPGVLADEQGTELPVTDEIP